MMNKSISAISTVGGALTSNLSAISNLFPPVQVSYASLDRGIDSLSLMRFDQYLKKTGVPVNIKVYYGVHSDFLRQNDLHYDATAATDVHRRITNFFIHHLF
jgi:dienelactone hydrolase